MAVKRLNRKSIETKRRIVRAASELFATDGYANTTFQDIADAAGVAVQTVYFHYGNKRNILKHAVDVASAGDDEPIPLLARPWVDEVRTQRDGPAAVRRWVEESGVILARVAPILAAVRDAAPGDPDMADQWATNRDQRRMAYGQLVAILNQMHALRPDLSLAAATDTTVALLGPELYLLLTRDCAWSTGQWETWVTDQLVYALIGPRP